MTVAVQGVRVNTETCPVAITSFEDPQCITQSTFDNITAIVGGAAAVIIILILTVIVIAVCVRKNQKYKYSTDQAVG